MLDPHAELPAEEATAHQFRAPEPMTPPELIIAATNELLDGTLDEQSYIEYLHMLANLKMDAALQHGVIQRRYCLSSDLELPPDVMARLVQHEHEKEARP